MKTSPSRHHIDQGQRQPTIIAVNVRQLKLVREVAPDLPRIVWVTPGGDNDHGGRDAIAGQKLLAAPDAGIAVNSRM